MKQEVQSYFLDYSGGFSRFSNYSLTEIFNDRKLLFKSNFNYIAVVFAKTQLGSTLLLDA